MRNLKTLYQQFIALQQDAREDVATVAELLNKFSSTQADDPLSGFNYEDPNNPWALNPVWTEYLIDGSELGICLKCWRVPYNWRDVIDLDNTHTPTDPPIQPYGTAFVARFITFDPFADITQIDWFNDFTSSGPLFEKRNYIPIGNVGQYEFDEIVYPNVYSDGLYSLEDVLDAANKIQSFSECIYDIASSFLSAEKLSLSSFYLIVDAYKDKLPADNINKLRKLASAALSKTGDLTRYSALEVIRNFNIGAKESYENPSIELDTNKINFISSYVAMIVDAITTVVTTVVAVALTYLNKVIAIVTIAIAATISKINEYTKTASDELFIDENATTPYFYGPVLAASKHAIASDESLQFKSKLFYDFIWDLSDAASSSGSTLIRTNVYGPYDTYAWRNKASSGQPNQVLVNTYLHSNFLSIEWFVYELYRNLSIDKLDVDDPSSGAENTCILRIPSTVAIPQIGIESSGDYYLDFNEQGTRTNSPSEVAVRVTLGILMTHFFQQEYDTPGLNPAVYVHNGFNDYDGSYYKRGFAVPYRDPSSKPTSLFGEEAPSRFSGSREFWDWYSRKFIQYTMGQIAGVIRARELNLEGKISAIDESWFSEINPTECVEFLQNFYKYVVYDSFGTLLTQWRKFGDSSDWIQVLQNDNGQYSNHVLGYGVAANSYYSNLTPLATDIQTNDAGISPLLPTEYKYNVPKILLGDLRGALITYAAVAVGVSILAVVSSIKVKKKLTSLRESKSAHLKSKYDAFTARPTDSALQKDYMKAMKSYNKWASLLNWPSFSNGTFFSAPTALYGAAAFSKDSISASNLYPLMSEALADVQTNNPILQTIKTRVDGLDAPQYVDTSNIVSAVNELNDRFDEVKADLLATSDSLLVDIKSLSSEDRVLLSKIFTLIKGSDPA